MPLTINGKVFLNLQEAVAWLLADNALPFQSTANYVADTEIAKTTIINPSPAKIKIGSLVLFADGKVGTVSGITANGFMVGAESTDLSDGVPHITNIQINASNHLIFTMSEGDPIDAGLIKEVSSMSIDASQHLIVNYNDGTTNDLGAIFQGNINIAGNFTADSIIENMSGYSFDPTQINNQASDLTYEKVYIGCVKNGNKITFVHAFNITPLTALGASILFGTFRFPSAVGNKLYPTQIGVYNYLCADKVQAFSGPNTSVELGFTFEKGTATSFWTNLYGANNLVVNTKYYVRLETTFLLSDSL